MALKKPLAPSRLTVYGVGTIIGDGIHSVIGPAEAKAGAGLSPSFVMAGGHLRGLCRFVLGAGLGAAQYGPKTTNSCAP